MPLQARRSRSSTTGSPPVSATPPCCKLVHLQATRACCPELDAAVGSGRGPASRMIKDLFGDGNILINWMGPVDAALQPPRSFTAGLRRELDAVVAELSLQHSSGAVEAPSTASSS